MAVSYYIAEEHLQSKVPKVPIGLEFASIHKILEGKGALETQINVLHELLVKDASDDLTRRMKIALITLGEAAYQEMLLKYQNSPRRGEVQIKNQEESLQDLNQISRSVGTEEHLKDTVHENEIEHVQNEREETKICKDKSSARCNQNIKQNSGRAINSESYETMSKPLSTCTTSTSGMIDSGLEKHGEELPADTLQKIYLRLLEDFPDEDQSLEYQKRTAEALELTAKAAQESTEAIKAATAVAIRFIEVAEKYLLLFSKNQ